MDWVNWASGTHWVHWPVAQAVPHRRQVSAADEVTPASLPAAVRRRSWPENAYGARKGVPLGTFERSLNRASSGGGGIAGPSRKRRRRRGLRRRDYGRQRKRWYGALWSKRKGCGGSARSGESNGRDPVTKRSPEGRRRRARAVSRSAMMGETTTDRARADGERDREGGGSPRGYGKPLMA